jgi:alpha-tubulin suppressor-like RCC1 family protein
MCENFSMIKHIGKLPLMVLAVATISSASGATTNLPPSPIVQVWGGGRHTMALLSDGTVWTWGSDYAGKLGDNQFCVSYTDDSHDSHVPLQVHGPGNVGYLSSIVAISAGESHNMALRSDGTVWTWGWNYFGQLGNGTTNDAHTPIQVVGLSNVVAISGRAYHCMALKSDGTVWAWGWNINGQLGNGSADSNLHALPTQVIGLTNPATISAGYAVGLALMSNGTVQIWGTSTYGELAQGEFGVHSYTPIPVPGISNVVSISSGFQEPEALKSDGTIWMWGYNNVGQLGDDTTNDTCVPAQVLDLTNMIFAGQTGDRDSCAIRADHTVWTWGRNYNGQLGIGTQDLVAHSLPVQMPDFGNGGYVVMVQTPDWHSLALRSDGTLWAWGANDHGQLGNGDETTNSALSPTEVVWPVPTNAVSPLLLTVAPLPAAQGSVTLAFLSTSGASYTIQVSTDLGSANWSSYTNCSGNGSNCQFTIPVLGASDQFFRIRSP